MCVFKILIVILLSVDYLEDILRINTHSLNTISELVFYANKTVLDNTLLNLKDIVCIVKLDKLKSVLYI